MVSLLRLKNNTRLAQPFHPSNSFILDVVLLGIVAEGAISDLECLCRASSDPIGLLSRRLQITALRIGHFLLEIDPLGGYVQPPTGDGGCANAGVSGNTVRQHGKGYFRAALQRHGTFHSV